MMTNLNIENNATVTEVMHFILFQEPKDPSLDTETYVWKRVSVQSGGLATIPIPFEVSYTATVQKPTGERSRSRKLSASNGDVLIVTRDPQSDAPVLKKDQTSAHTIFKTSLF